MPEQKHQSLFEDTLRHDVHTVSELWRHEQRRRRVLMARIFVPGFIVLVVAWLLTARHYQVFPFRPDYEALAAAEAAKRETMEAESVETKLWTEKLGYEKALLKIELVEQGGTCCSSEEILKLLYAFADANPSRIYMERWTFEKYQGELKKKIGQGHQFAVFVNGQDSIEVMQPNGTVERLSLVFDGKEGAFCEKLSRALNQTYRRLYQTDKDALDYQAFCAPHKVEQKAAPLPPPKQEDIVLKKLNFDLGK